MSVFLTIITIMVMLPIIVMMMLPIVVIVMPLTIMVMLVTLVVVMFLNTYYSRMRLSQTLVMLFYPFCHTSLILFRQGLELLR